MAVRQQALRSGHHVGEVTGTGNRGDHEVPITQVRRPIDDARPPLRQRLSFRPGAVADHLTSAGGILEGATQMPITEWLGQGATASYGTVSEPCNHRGKFPSPGIFLDHYLRGDTLLEAYWKSVAMPGQGLFIGEPLARPYAPKP